MKKLTREQVLALVKYDPGTGKLTFNELPNVHGWINGGGYHVVRLYGTDFYVHRLAIFITYGVWPEAVDHVNGNKLDNRISNLRIATRQENLFNSRCRSDSASGVKGVKRHGKGWRAKIKRDGITYSLGTFPTIEEAGEAYRRAAAKLHEAYSYAGTDNAAVRAAKALVGEGN
jgi:hypothetical protein